MHEFAVFSHIQQADFGKDTQVMRNQSLIELHMRTQLSYSTFGMLVQDLQNQYPIGLLQVVEYLIGGFHPFICEERFHGVPKIANITGEQKGVTKI